MSEFDKTNSLVLGGGGTHSTVHGVKTKTQEGLETIFSAQQTSRIGNQSIVFIQPNNRPSPDVMSSGGAYTDFSLPFTKERIVEMNRVIDVSATTLVSALPATFFVD